MEMLRDRGYNLNEEKDNDKTTMEEFKTMFHQADSKAMTILADKVTDMEDKIMIFFPLPDVEAKTRRIGSGQRPLIQALALFILGRGSRCYRQE